MKITKVAKTASDPVYSEKAAEDLLVPDTHLEPMWRPETVAIRDAERWLEMKNCLHRP